MTAATEDAERALAAADDAFARLDVDALVAHLSAAIRGFTAAGDVCRAATTSVQLGEIYANVLGNLTAARAWYTRARRLVADVPDCVEQGWVAIAGVGCEVNDPAELLAAAELALDRARRFGDVNLETKALADAGLAHVQSGRIAEGMALLDEAMALACGPADAVEPAAKSVCSFFTACYYTADFGRVATWSESIRRRGLIGTHGPGPAFLSGHCDMVQATMLVELGRWDEAEALLLEAKATVESVLPTEAWHPTIGLADLRVRQRRLEEAEQLLVGKEQAADALLPWARLNLARGDHELAAAAARRGLKAMREDRLRAAELLTVLVDAELGRGDLDAAQRACEDLTRRVADVEIPGLRARADAARARVLAAGGSVDDAASVLEEAIDSIDPRQLPVLHAGLVEQLRQLRSHPGARTASLRRDGKWWTVSDGGTTARLADTKGLRYVADLVASPGQERHVLDLVDRDEGTGDVDRRTLRDAGAALDSTARSQYRRRIEALRAEIDDALDSGRIETAERLQDELDHLVRQLAAAFGLGGRARPTGSAAEKARLNVTRAIRAAIGKVVEVLPAAGAVLDRRVRTGTYCVYEPAADDPFRWTAAR